MLAYCLSGEHEPIYIEGKASDIRDVLTTILAMLDGEEILKRQEFDGRHAREIAELNRMAKV